MLHVITDVFDEHLSLVNDDPVRPGIAKESRVGNNKEIFVLKCNQESKAVVCVSYQSEVPTSESELFSTNADPTIAVFYTIWSYTKGAGRQLIFNTVDHLVTTKPSIERFVTLSPKTEMARRFHLSNGAVVFQENENTVNYEYRIRKS